MVNRVVDKISDALDIHTHGGTIFQRDDRTVILADYGTIDTIAMERIVKLFPNLTYCVQSSAASSSGFIVIFTVLDYRQIAVIGSQVWFQSCITMCVCLCSLVFVVLFPCLQTSYTR